MTDRSDHAGDRTGSLAPVAVHQIYFQGEQRSSLDPAFLPYDNTENARPEWCEYWIFRKEYFGNRTEGPGVTGYLSWKFATKTLISGGRFIQFIREHPGYDVYFINPFQEVRYAYPNVWIQGDYNHPGLLSFAGKLFARAGYAIDLETSVFAPCSAALANYWVGNAAFWAKYIGFCEPIFDLLENRLTQLERAFVAKRADVSRSANYYPFIMERMFSTLLEVDTSIRAIGYQYSFDELRAKYGPHRAAVLEKADAQTREIRDDFGSAVVRCRQFMRDFYGPLGSMLRSTRTGRWVSLRMSRLRTGGHR